MQIGIYPKTIIKALQLIIILSISYTSCNMNNFNFENAEVFSQLVDESEDTTNKMPGLNLIDIQFVKLAKLMPVSESKKTLFKAFEELNIKSFNRYKSSALFVLEQSESSLTAYRFTNIKTYETLPEIERHYKVLSIEEVRTDWQLIQLERLPFDEK